MTIRNATINDLQGILGLVHQLAEYEKSAEQVSATIDDYIRGYNDQVFEALIAVDDQDRVVGTSIFYLTWSTWKGRMLYLEDFVVDQKMRQSGIGQLLFNATIDRAREMGCRLIKWQVLEWNTPALRFYAKNNAVIEKDWWNGKLVLGPADNCY